MKLSPNVSRHASLLAVWRCRIAAKGAHEEREVHLRLPTAVALQLLGLHSDPLKCPFYKCLGGWNMNLRLFSRHWHLTCVLSDGISVRQEHLALLFPLGESSCPDKFCHEPWGLNLENAFCRWVEFPSEFAFDKHIFTLVFPCRKCFSIVLPSNFHLTNAFKIWNKCFFWWHVHCPNAILLWKVQMIHAIGNEISICHQLHWSFHLATNARLTAQPGGGVDTVSILHL